MPKRTNMYQKGERIDSWDDFMEMIFERGEYLWMESDKRKHMGRPIHPDMVMNMTIKTLWLRWRSGELFRAERTKGD